MQLEPRCTRTVVFVYPFLARCRPHRAFIMPILPAWGRNGHHHSGQCVPCPQPDADGELRHQTEVLPTERSFHHETRRRKEQDHRHYRGAAELAHAGERQRYHPGEISIHALLAESDHLLLFRQSDLQFLSTLSLRRATGGKQSFIRMDRIFLSTLSLRRATGLAGKVEDAINISIHALLAESDHDWPPVRDIIQWISIHALLAESDMIHPRLCNAKLNFYPRSPCGERL